MRGHRLRVWSCILLLGSGCGSQAPKLPHDGSFAPVLAAETVPPDGTGLLDDTAPRDDTAAPTCDVAPCTGCCDADNACVEVVIDTACARTGESCTDCTVDLRSCAPDGACINTERLPDGEVDDRSLRISSVDRALRMRDDLRYRIFGQTTLPSLAVARSASAVPDPFDLEGSEPLLVERLEFDLPGGTVTPVWVLTPETPSGRVVVVHQGHWHTLKEGRLASVAEAALASGAIVVGLTMPLYGESTGPLPTHDDLIARFPEDLPGHGVQVFLLPIVGTLDHLEARQPIESVSMVGISGGGWTTLLYAAIDPRIERSIPVAGGEPLYQREGTDWGDREQHDTTLYEVAGYLDLHVLGTLEADRQQVVVLHRYDTCCFAGTGYQDWEASVGRAVTDLGGGSFRVFLDESIRGHEVSPHVLAAVIEPTLTGDTVRYFDDTLPAYGVFSTDGAWSVDGSAGFGNDSARGTGGTARWDVSVPAGPWSAALTWAPDGNLSPEVTVSWRMADESATATIDQTAPPADFSAADADWHVLASGVLDAPATLTVTLEGGSSDPIRADALRVDAAWAP